MKATNQLVAGVLEILQVIHAMRRKLEILKADNHPDLKLWAKPWRYDDYGLPLPTNQTTAVSSITSPIKTELGTSANRCISLEPENKITPSQTALPPAAEELISSVMTDPSILDGNRVPSASDGLDLMNGDLISFLTSNENDPIISSSPMAAFMEGGPTNIPNDMDHLTNQNNTNNNCGRVSEEDGDSESTIIDGMPSENNGMGCDQDHSFAHNPEQRSSLSESGVSQESRKLKIPSSNHENYTSTPKEHMNGFILPPDLNSIGSTLEGPGTSQNESTVDPCKNHSSTTLPMDVDVKPEHLGHLPSSNGLDCIVKKEVEPCDEPQISPEQQFIERCKQNLADHLQDTYKKLKERYQLITERLEELEKEEGIEKGQNADELDSDLAHLKDYIKGFYIDLETVKRMTLIKNQ